MSVAVRAGRLLASRSWAPRRVGRGRTKDARDGRQVEHAEEHGDAFHDARPDLVVEGVPVVDVPAIDGFHAEPDLGCVGTLEPLTVVCDRVVCDVLDHGRRRRPAHPFLVGRVLREADGAQLAVVVEKVRQRNGDPLAAQRLRVGLRLFDLLGEQRLVDGAVVHVSQRHPSGRVAAVLGRQHPVQLDDPADEIRVRLLPEGFFPFAEELIQERGHRVGERVRIEPRRTQRIPRQPAIEGQLDVVLVAAQLGEHPADVVAEIAFDFQHERGGAALGIVGLPAEELARERVHAGRRLAGPDRAENCHAGIEAPLRDRQPFRGRALGDSDPVMHLADDDGRAVRRRRKGPARKAGPEPQTDAHPGEPDP